MIREVRKATSDIKNEIELDEAIRKPLEELRDATLLPPEELKRQDRVRKEQEAQRAADEKARLALEREEREAAGAPSPADEPAGTPAPGGVPADEPLAAAENPDATRVDLPKDLAGGAAPRFPATSNPLKPGTAWRPYESLPPVPPPPAGEAAPKIGMGLPKPTLPGLAPRAMPPPLAPATAAAPPPAPSSSAPKTAAAAAPSPAGGAPRLPPPPPIPKGFPGSSKKA